MLTVPHGRERQPMPRRKAPEAKIMLFWLAVVVGLLSAAGCCYLVVAALLIHRFVRRGVLASRTSSPGVTILKPLHGAAPGLAENITSFCIQNYPGPTQRTKRSPPWSDCALDMRLAV